MLKFLDCYSTTNFPGSKQHVDDLCKRLKSRLSLLRRINPFLTLERSFHFYNACIHSHLLYCSSACGNSSLTSLLRLLRVQKHAARVILNADFLVFFSKLKWIPICDLVKWRILQLQFCIILNPDAPLCLNSIWLSIDCYNEGLNVAQLRSPSSLVFLPIPPRYYLIPWTQPLCSVLPVQ